MASAPLSPPRSRLILDPMPLLELETTLRGTTSFIAVVAALAHRP